ncbi:MAG: hypothetical protein IKD76_07635 [Clostridia bacterium]|nr:hypothetical protein [Clostridia bacterium]
MIYVNFYDIIFLINLLLKMGEYEMTGKEEKIQMPKLLVVDRKQHYE